MRLARDLSGRALAKALETLGYQITRQTGSHLRLTTQERGEHPVTIPNHKALVWARSPGSWMKWPSTFS